MATVGEELVRWLEAYGIDTVFGIPGVHTIEMYRGLARSSIKHMTPRHEQGAGFMADGYARASGRVAAAFVITGPGLTNIATPMAQAYGDSIPMLVVSSVNARRPLGMGAGDLHEVKRQGLIGEQCAAFSHTLSDPEQLPEVLARAFAVFEGARPRPVHIEIPKDMFSEQTAPAPAQRPARLHRPIPAAASLAEAAAALSHAEAPLILAGGGLRDRGAEPLCALAEALGAPVVMTTNGRGLMGPDHPLAVPCSPSLKAVRRLIDSSDVVLALGTEIGRTDYDWNDAFDFQVPGHLIRVDLDAEQLTRGIFADLPLVGDATETAAALTPILDRAAPALKAAERAEEARRAAFDELEPSYRDAVRVLEVVTSALPGVPLIGDSTHPIYAGNMYHRAHGPAQWFNSSTGYGALGYGLPAAIGAARANGGPVVCIAGDGGLQFSLAELGLAVEEQLPVILIVWNNESYGEIKRWMQVAQVSPVGVDLHSPDFCKLAEAYGAATARLGALEEFPDLLRDATGRQGPTVIDFPEHLAVTH